MQTAQFFIDTVCLLYLFSLAGRLGVASHRRRPGLSALPVPPDTGGPGSALRLWLGCTAGLGLAWLARTVPGGMQMLTGAAIALAAGLGLRLRAGREDTLSDALTLLDRMRRETAGGSDFFAALGAARGELPDRPMRRAVDAALGGYSQRLPFPDCLRRLASTDRILAGLAADVRRAGWVASPLLAQTVELVQSAAVRKWDRQRGARVRLDRLGERLPGVRSFAAGAAAAGLVFSGSAVAAGGGTALAILMGLAYLARSAALRRLVRLGGGLAALLVLLPAAAGGPIVSPPAPVARAPMLETSPAGTVRLPEPLPAPRPGFQPIFDPIPDRRAPAPVVTCRIVTGVPGGLVNVRARPGMDGVVSFYVADGELLETTGETGDAAAGAWKRVRTEDGRNGWVYARLCESNDD